MKNRSHSSPKCVSLVVYYAGSRASHSRHSQGHRIGAEVLISSLAKTAREGIEAQWVLRRISPGHPGGRGEPQRQKRSANLSRCIRRMEQNQELTTRELTRRLSPMALRHRCYL